MIPKERTEPSKEFSISAREEAAKIAEKTIAEFKMKIEESGTSDRANLAEAVVADNFLKPIYDITQNWDKLVEETSAQFETGGLNKKQAQEKAEKYYVDLVKERSSYLKGLTDNKLAPANIGVSIEKLLEMEQSSKKFTELLMKNPEQFKDLQDALLYVLGRPSFGTKKRPVNDPERVLKIKQTITDTLMTEFLGDKTKPKEKFSYAAAILSLADSTVRVDMIKDYLKAEPKQENKKPVLEALNHLGAISPLEMQALMNQNNIPISNEEIKRYAEGYDAKHNFTQTAKALAKDGFGAHNWLNDNFNIKGLGVLLGYICGTMTIGANLIVNRKHIIEHGPLSMLNDPYYFLGAGEIAMAKALHSEGTLKETLASNSETLAWDEIKSKEALTLGLNSSPLGWKKFFEDDDKKGFKAFGEFIRDNQESSKLQEGKFTLETFKIYLSAKSTNQQDNIAMLNEIKDLKLEDDPLVADKFNKFTKAFLGLKLWGNKAEKKYEKLTEVV
ncbi:MAG: hypothetical protein WC806_02695 [Candidatus Gracilibacteria bacterium]|jgi:hypothetical protein